MILGATQDAGASLTLNGGKLYLFDVGAGVLGQDLIVGSLAAIVDGLGGGAGTQRIRPVVAEADDVVGTAQLGDERLVEQGAPAAWEHLTFDLPPRVRAGHMPLVGFLVGDTPNVVRVHGAVQAGTGDSWTVEYGDTLTVPGAPEATVALLPALCMIGVTPWAPPENVTEEQLAALPLDVASGVFSKGAPVGDPQAANAGWIYLHDAPPAPAICVVRTGGPLEDLVGERLLVTYEPADAPARSVAVYVDDEDDFDPELADEDLRLSRVAFERLAPLWTDLLPVTVEVIAA